MTNDGFALRLRELLEHRRMSLKHVADGVGLSRTAVHKWTRGGAIDQANLRKLADLLNVNWLWLGLGDESTLAISPSEVPQLPITDLRRKMTAEIISNEARMNLAQSVAGVVTWEWNLLSDELFYSANCVQLYGKQIHNNDEFWALLYGDDRAPLRAIIENALLYTQPYHHDFRIVLPDGQLRWIESRTDFILDQQQRPLRMLGVTIDISARKEREQQQLQRIHYLEQRLAAI